MTKSDPPIGSGHDNDLADVLRRERLARTGLESRVADLEEELDVERAKLERVTSRKSVRLALKAAALGRPLLRALRRPQEVGGDLSPSSSQAAVTAAICSNRNDPGAESGPLVTMVMLNRDGAQHLERLLPTLRDGTTYRSFELVVIDNGSTDESMDLLNEDWGFPLRVVRNDGNVSFSHGCNQGIALATGTYVLLLNNDITPINSGWLGALVAGLEEDPARGAAGALLVYPERPGYVSGDPNTGADLTVQHRGIAFRWRRNAEPDATVPWAYNMGVGEDPTHPDLVSTIEVPAATAACLLVRRDLLARLGGLDEGFTYGMEDVDLSLRIRTAGSSVVIVGAAALYHHEFGTQSVIAVARKRANGLANLQHFSKKWGPRLSRLLQLESLLPEPQHLRHQPPPVVAITVTRDDPDLADKDWSVAHELGTVLTSAGYSVLYAEQYEERWYDLENGVATIITLLDQFDVRRAPPDATTVAWIDDGADRWTTQPWFGMHDVYIPGSEHAAKTLAAAGVTTTEALTSAEIASIPRAAHGLILKPRIALNVAPMSQVQSQIAIGLADHLRNHGANPRLTPLDNWTTPAAQCVDVVVHVREIGPYEPLSSHVNVLWITDPEDPTTPAECQGYDWILVASHVQAEKLGGLIGVPVNTVGQATLEPRRLSELAKRLRQMIDQLEWQPCTQLEDC